MNTEYTIKEEKVTIYRVHFRDQYKTFFRKSAIPGWIAKKALLPIMNKFHEVYGEMEDETEWGTSTYTVFRDWNFLKDKFLKDYLEFGLEQAEIRMNDYIENYWC